MIDNEKYAAELQFWTEELGRYVQWYRGGMREFYGIPAPTEAQKIRRHDSVERNALDTWINADRWRYCWHLFVEPTYFAGKKVLEIGPGPLGLAQWFIGASLYAADPLLEAYRNAGYPVDEQAISYCAGFAEALPYHDSFFDAVISINAIDHVDDFERAISEIERVVKPDGEIRIETHFHAATTTEPCVLTEDRVVCAFQEFDVKIASSMPSSYFYPRGTHPASDRFVLWTNSPTSLPLFNAREALR